MRRSELEHVIRAAGAIAGVRELVIIGSQAILGQHPDAPEELLTSIDVDIYPPDDPQRAAVIDGSIGELSPFHEQFGYYAHGVGPETAKLPCNWRSRTVAVINANTGGVTGLCLGPSDLAVSKMLAGREKDFEFVRAMAKHGLIGDSELSALAVELPQALSDQFQAVLKRCFQATNPQPARHGTDSAARRLVDAWRSGDRIPNLGAARPRSRDEAYAIQDAVTGLLGLQVVGWKVGAATPAIMGQRALEEPIPGPLFGPRVYASAATLPADDFPAANLETELAFRTLDELPPRRARYEPAALAAMSELLAAFDLTQSRYATPPDALAEIADSGNSGGAVIGTPLRGWRDRDLMRVTVELRVDGCDPVPTYTGAWRRDPLDVFAWLVNSLGRRGIALPAGAVILTGSLTEPRPVAPGSSAVARFEGGAEVRMSIAG